jgi:hypothetical protein
MKSYFNKLEHDFLSKYYRKKDSIQTKYQLPLNLDASIDENCSKINKKKNEKKQEEKIKKRVVKKEKKNKSKLELIFENKLNLEKTNLNQDASGLHRVPSSHSILQTNTSNLIID